MIPKTIHYCWFGGNEKSELIKKCIESWKRYCPDWEIKEWNESNFDISSYIFCKEAYEKKKWAFVSDVARLLIIFEQGGVYLDTDVELKDSINQLCDYSSFFAFENEIRINSGSGFGAVKKHPAVKAMLDYYSNQKFILKNKLNTIPCPKGNTEALLKVYPELRTNGKTQIIDDTIIISPSEYSKLMYHHGTASWSEKSDADKENILPKRTYKDTRIKKFLRDEKRYLFVKTHFNKKILDLYTFIAYDFLEFGFMYFIKKSIRKFSDKLKK